MYCVQKIEQMRKNARDGVVGQVVAEMVGKTVFQNMGLVVVAIIIEMEGTLDENKLMMALVMLQYLFMVVNSHLHESFYNLNKYHYKLNQLSKIMSL